METTLSKTEQLMREVRKMPIFRQLIPMEAGVGWPLPFRKDGETYVTLPFYGIQSSAQAGETQLFPPFATLTFRWSNLRPVEYVDLRYRSPSAELDWEKPAGVFPHPAVASLTRADYLQMRQELLTMYDQLLQGLSSGAPQPEGWEQRFKQLLDTLIEPGLLPYYQAIAPRFISRFTTQP